MSTRLGFFFFDVVVVFVFVPPGLDLPIAFQLTPTVVGSYKTPPEKR